MSRDDEQDWTDAMLLNEAIVKGEVVNEDSEHAVKHTPPPEEVAAIFAAQQNPDTEKINEYVCEGCGKVENLTERDAFEQGWDYPPFMGSWGIVSPRTCGDCDITTTAYWAILRGFQSEEAMGPKHWATVMRITQEKERDDA